MASLVRRLGSACAKLCRDCKRARSRSEPWRCRMPYAFEFESEPFEFESTFDKMFETFDSELADEEWLEEAGRLRAARPIRTPRPSPPSPLPPPRPPPPSGRLPRRGWPIAY